jgi:hypothetical protein
MTDQHPITPPPELVQQWARHILTPEEGGLALDLDWFANQAARWGAEMELEACCEWLFSSLCEDPQEVSQELRTARRPKPPSLKQQGLEAAIRLGKKYPSYEGADIETIIRVLEALPND